MNDIERKTVGFSLRGLARRDLAGNETESSSTLVSDNENHTTIVVSSEVKNVTSMSASSPNATANSGEIIEEATNSTNTTTVSTENPEEESASPVNSTLDSTTSNDVKEKSPSTEEEYSETTPIVAPTNTTVEDTSTAETPQTEGTSEEIQEKQNSTSISKESKSLDDGDDGKGASSSNGRMWPEFDPIDILKKTFGLNDDELEPSKKHSEQKSDSIDFEEKKEDDNKEDKINIDEAKSTAKSYPTSTQVEQKTHDQKQQQIHLQNDLQRTSFSQNGCPSLFDGNTTLIYKLECSTFSTIGSHPAGSLTAFLVFFFVCYCGCRVQQSRRLRYGSDKRGEYAALAVYDDLLDGNFNDEISSYCHSSDESVETILSNWSGNANGQSKNTFEMSRMRNGKNETNFNDDDFLTLEEING